MANLIDFAKIEATGNDFVFINSNTNDTESITTGKIQAICNRHTGIGADGVILISEGEDHPVRMTYFNADGSRGAMCGNGLRASVLYSYLHNKVKLKTWQTIEADDGIHQVYMNSSEEIKVEIKVNRELRSVDRKILNINNSLQTLGFINTGVPHLVLQTESDLDDIDIIKTGRSLRYHKFFQPEGTNVNFLKINRDNYLTIRTYERGVENETLSCGTGIIASVISYWSGIKPDSKTVNVETAGGKLSVLRENGTIFLKGPARVAFVGQYLNV
ncbi:MAG: diaminopimelate epimerase [Calditrichaceae bacterium]